MRRAVSATNVPIRWRPGYDSGTNRAGLRQTPLYPDSEYFRAIRRWKRAGTFETGPSCVRKICPLPLRPESQPKQRNLPRYAPLLAFGSLLLGLAATPRAHAAAHGGPQPLTVSQLEAAQQAWCEALISISKTHREGGDAKALAAKIIDAAYNYGNGPVLFKPTLTYGEQTFRTTREGALAYFVGGNPAFPNDKGFALKPWAKARFVNAATYIEGNLGTTMGHVIITDTSGKETKVEKTWIFRRGDDGKLRIVLHKSAIPYAPPAA